MSMLLDTHAALWLAALPERLSESATAIVRDSPELFFSTASAWEIAVKYATGRQPLPAVPEQFLPELIRRLKLTVLPIELAHAVRAGSLPAVHRDPFDRMLVAQAQVLSVPILTVDPKIARYDVETIPA